MAASSVDLPTSFQRHLRAENKSARTVETYLAAVQQLDTFLAGRGVDAGHGGVFPAVSRRAARPL